MFKLVVVQKGQPDREVVVEGDSATVGRVPTCDVVVDLPYVSKKHLRILNGLVVADLGSINGTFVEGERLTGAELLQGRSLTLSQDGVRLVIEAQREPGMDTVGADSVPPSSIDLDPDLENLRGAYALLEAEAERLKEELKEARDTGDQEELIGRLKGENESLRERLTSLKEDLEAREEDDGLSVQARLAMQRVETVQELNDKLQAEVEWLKAELEAREGEPPAESGTAAVAPPPAPIEGREAELEEEVERLNTALAEHEAKAQAQKEQAKILRMMRKELETLRAGKATGQASPETEQALATSRQEVAALKAKVGELEGRLAEGPAARPENVSDLFFKLQAENAELKRKLGAGAGAEAAPEPASKHIKELMEARLKITALESELSNLKVKVAPTGPIPMPIPAKKPAVAESARAAAGTPAAAGATRHIFEVFSEEDAEGLSRPTGGAVEDFLLIESLRLLRQVERVVTRVAGDLIQLFRLQTMLPDTVGTYRDHVATLLKEPDNQGARAHMVEYLETLGRWLVASIGAHRKAAVLFAGKLKEDLTERGLTAGAPLPPFAKVPMLQGSELWKRVQDHLKSLTPDTIDERLDEIAREQAQLLLNETS